MSDVFISYKRRLRPQVERIATALRDLGIDVWFDAALEPGVSFSAEISNEVRSAGCVLVCFSDDAFPHGGDQNGWVLGEASIGRKRGRLVTVMLDETEFDPPWNMIHTERLVGFDPADFAADRTGWRGALAAIGRLIDRPGLADYDRAIAAGTADALKAWAQMFPKDVLAERVWAKIEEIELAMVRRRLAEERVRPLEKAPEAPPRPAEPERVYAPLPEQNVEPATAPAPKPEPKPDPDPDPVAPRPIVEPGPRPPPPFSPPVAAAIAGLIATIGAALIALIVGDADDTPLFYFATFGGPAAAMALLGALLVVSGYLKIWRAIVLALAGYVGYFLALFTAEFLTRSAPSFGTEGADIAGGFAMGAVGALVVLFALVMLSRNPNMGRAIPISLSGVLLVGVATAVVMVLPGISLRNGNNVLWGGPVWYAALGAVLVWLLAPEYGTRPAVAARPSNSALKLSHILVAGFAGVVVCAGGALSVINLGPNNVLAFVLIVVGGAVFATPLAILLGRTGAFARLSAAALPLVVGLIGFLVVIVWSNVAQYSYDYLPTAAFVGVAALAGAGLTGLAIGLLSRRPLPGRFWLVLTVFALVEGLVLATIVAAFTYLAHSQAGVVLMPLLWQTVMVMALPFLLEPVRFGVSAPSAAAS